MDRPKLNYRFHNANRTNEELIKALLSIFIEANRDKVEAALINESDNEDVPKENEQKDGKVLEKTSFVGEEYV